MTLRSLHISNVVLIDRLMLEFHDGLTALTGETGAGKSILLDSLGLVTGARADTSLIRKNENQAIVTAEFDVEKNHQAYEILRSQAVDVDDGPLVLRRQLTADGKSRAFINDAPVSVTLLREVGEALVDIHGQFETYGLLNPAQHGIILDDYAGLKDDLITLSSLWDQWKLAQKNYDDAVAQLEAARREEDWLRQSVDDLAKLNAQVNEEAEILSTRQKLQHKSQIIEAAQAIEDIISGNDGMERQLAQLWRNVNKLSDRLGEEAIVKMSENLDQVAKYLQAVQVDVTNVASNSFDDFSTPESLDDRLYELRNFARRYNCLCDELPDLLISMRQKLAMMDQDSAHLSKLEQIVSAAKSVWLKKAQDVSAKRIKASKKLDQSVNAELPPLKLDKAKFRAMCVPQDAETRWGPRGFDHVIFDVSTNGGDFGALNKVASGGEMARFMLALKLVLAESQNQNIVYVFDEIDTGIGGGTAAAVGERLARLAQNCQVMVVTHSPQVAANAACHLSVSKASGVTYVAPLDTVKRVEEIARMLAGATITDEARAAARQLLNTQKGKAA